MDKETDKKEVRTMMPEEELEKVIEKAKKTGDIELLAKLVRELIEIDKLLIKKIEAFKKDAKQKPVYIA